MALKGKRVLVIGGGSGIGFAVARAAADAGADVMIASSNASKLRDAAQRIGHGVSSQQLDVTAEKDVEAFFAASGQFDHIVFTAGNWAHGGLNRGAFAGIDIAQAVELFNVRFWGAVKVAKYGAPRLQPNGSLTVTDGTIAHRPQIGTAITTSMTGAVEHLTRGLAVELAPIRVNAVCPGLIRTAIWDRIPEATRESELKARTSRLLVPRPGEPEEVAEAYMYLMRADYTTGQVLYVEGGRLLV